MLVIHSRAEPRLALMRQFMNNFDHAVFYTYKVESKRRVELEDILDYLRTYGCKLTIEDEQGNKTTQIEIENFRVELNCDAFEPKAFVLAWFRKGEAKSNMIGGLVYHGPMMKDYDPNDQCKFADWFETLTKDQVLADYKFWGVHT